MPPLQPLPAKELLKSVIKVAPKNIKVYQYLGFCFIRLNDIDKSIETYKKAADIDDNNWQTYRGLGFAYMFKALEFDDESFKKKAIEYWRRSLSINHDQPNKQKLLKLIKYYSQK